jgi:polar amino acid transport system substrate-binding protein
MHHFVRILLLLILPIVLAGCHRLKSAPMFIGITGPAKLRVGIATDTPPLAYKQDNTITGLETKFAAGLARFTQKPLELIELPRQELAPALLKGKIDIIMAGLSAADAQEQKLAAIMPYFVSGQVALVHLDDYKQLGNDADNLKAPEVRLGVVAATPGEVFVKGLKSKGKITRFVSAPEGVQALIEDTIDVFVYDLPANFYYAALYVDQGLTPGTTPMTRDPLVWAVLPGNRTMLKAANDYLAAIQQSGELQALIKRAIPFYQNTAYSPEK